MKRFYKMASVCECEGGYGIELDGRLVKTPLKASLVTKSKDLANTILKEWAEQGETIEPDSMPLTQMLNTQIDRITGERETLKPEIMKFLNTDLICYRIDGTPNAQYEEQAKLQCELLDPWVDWFERKFGSKLETTTAIKALEQDEAAHIAVSDYIDAMDDARFNVLQMSVPISGSLILGLAFADQEMSSEDLLKAARIEENFKDEIYNAEFYGRDPGQEEKDAAVLRDLKAAETYLKLH